MEHANKSYERPFFLTMQCALKGSRHVWTVESACLLGEPESCFEGAEQYLPLISYIYFIHLGIFYI